MFLANPIVKFVELAIILTRITKETLTVLHYREQVVVLVTSGYIISKCYRRYKSSFGGKRSL